MDIDNRIVDDQTSILKELAKYFETIYKKNDTLKEDNIDGIQDFLGSVTTEKISNIDREILDQDINVDEIGKALFELSNDSSPGLDGIPAGWYKVFYSKIKFLLYDCFKLAIEQGELELASLSLHHRSGPTTRRGRRRRDPGAAAGASGRPRRGRPAYPRCEACNQIIPSKIKKHIS